MGLANSDFDPLFLGKSLRRLRAITPFGPNGVMADFKPMSGS